jgi:hypothetical protein
MSLEDFEARLERSGRTAHPIGRIPTTNALPIQPPAIADDNSKEIERLEAELKRLRAARTASGEAKKPNLLSSLDEPRPTLLEAHTASGPREGLRTNNKNSLGVIGIVGMPIYGFFRFVLPAIHVPAELADDYIREALKPYGSTYQISQLQTVSLPDGVAEVRQATVILKYPHFNNKGQELTSDLYFFYKRGNQIKWGDTRFMIAIRMSGFDNASGENE